MINFEYLHNLSKEDTALAHLIRFAYHLLRHWFCQVLISILGTIVIGLMIGFQKINHFFFVICGFYIFLLIGTAICKSYDNYHNLTLCEKLKEVQEQAFSNQLLAERLDDELKSISTITSMASKQIYRIARDIKHDGWSRQIRDYRESYGFQQISFAVCKEVYDLFKLHFGMTNQWVTVYQRFESKEGDYCKMIGYYNSNYQEPSSYRKKYKIKPARKKKQEFHTLLMNKSESTLAILKNRQEIDKYFVFHPESSEREQQIQQYIGLAETVCNRNVFFILQIDTNLENGFGDSEEIIKTFTEEFIKPYAILLAMHYETDRLIEVSYNDAYINSKQKEGVGS